MDAIASLRPYPIDIQVGDDWVYTIPALPAADWIEAVLADDGLKAPVPGLLNDEDRSLVVEDYVFGRLSAEQIAEASREALEVAAGRPWWEADRLIRSAATREAWPIINGELVRRGFRFNEESVGAFCNTVYSMAVQGLKESDRATFEHRLTVPPAGVTVEELVDKGDLEADFFAALQEQGTLAG